MVVFDIKADVVISDVVIELLNIDEDVYNDDDEFINDSSEYINVCVLLVAFNDSRLLAIDDPIVRFQLHPSVRSGAL